MKKMGKTLALIFFVSTIILLLVSVDAQTTNPWSTGSNGAEKNAFTVLENVYAKSNAVCAPPATEVDLYIVKNNDNWTSGESLKDVRNSSQNIILENSKIPLTKIWLTPKTGDYDIVVDCNKNEEYDSYIDQIDSFSKVGFTVTAVAGTGKAELGKSDIGNHSWRYDPEAINLINEMLQINLTAEGEDIELTNITLEALGTGNDTELDKLEIYADENNNGKLDEDEIMIGDSQPAYTQDNGVTTIVLDYFLTKNIGENILIVYTMSETTTKGDFSLTIESIYGVGADSTKLIKFSGLPLNSGIKTVLPQKTCLGNLTLQLEPNPAPKNSIAKAKITGISGCENKTISLRTNPCGSSIKEEVGSCITKTEGCEMSFTALVSKTYHACIDKNSDGDMVDFGEYVFQDLVVIEPKVEEKINVTEKVNVSEVENVTEEKITGEVVGGIRGLGEKLSTSGSFLILLEVTLLLILFVLVMILFKLKGLSTSAMEKSKKE